MTTRMRTTAPDGLPGTRWRRQVALWQARAAERQALATMSERELRDIGVSPGEAHAEAAKPFWRA